jgi:hypothetical protein
MRPSVAAVLGLMTNWNFVGCCIGTSAGSAPFKMPIWQYPSKMSGSYRAAERGSGAVLGQNRFHAAGPAGRKATASISIFAFSSRPATCTAVLVGGSFGKNSPRMRENTAYGPRSVR